MKYLCIECDEAMEFVEADGPEEGSLSVTFICPKCQRSIALLTNPQETELVRALGVKLGGRTVPHEPFEQIRTTLVSKREGLLLPEGNEVIWTQEAEKRLAKVPDFVRPRAKKVIEEYARERGYREITTEIVEEAREKGTLKCPRILSAEVNNE